MEYIAYLHKDRDSDYGVSFPDFPGCITAGKTLDEASKMAAEALALHIQGMIEDGDAVPEPSKIDDIATDAARHGAIAFMVSVDAPDATVRVNITARESQLAKIDALAEAAGLTRSSFMVRAAIGTIVNQKKRSAHQRTQALNKGNRTRPVNEHSSSKSGSR
jgi:predicted RNase H-like HicB family nuclease